MHHFCLDIGGTNTRGALFHPDGQELARAKGPGGALSLGVDQAETSIRSVWRDISGRIGSQAPDPGDVAVLAGIAGFNFRDRARQLCDRLADFADTELVSDGYGALIAATNGRPGAMIAVGTGVAAMRLYEDGHSAFLSGWGFPAGDLGSGAWIGLRVMSDTLKRLDGSPVRPQPAPRFTQAVLDLTGRSVPELIDWHTGARPADLARLAPLVVEGAAAGDAYCRSVLDGAAREIADAGLALYPEGRGTIFLTGGLGASLAQGCGEAEPGIDWVTKEFDPIIGIHLIATGVAPPERIAPRPGLTPQPR
ncbi:BadF/BadG/BcrA/BcrD ATPase family protein [Cucumibacter marinus]|uniref:BadF/BadG/BcrA/BcrD ATPase family protein n=1 Tax=Cucumibacter marinus TaxID=1121252 RepID=UPI00042830EB|nr:BadF/BadG/BcrA/BcrD ATPase family protein [Cucumibacter marinus]